MKLTYNGHTVEGTAEEMVDFLNAIARVKARAQAEKQQLVDQKKMLEWYEKSVNVKLPPYGKGSYWAIMNDDRDESF